MDFIRLVALTALVVAGGLSWVFLFRKSFSRFLENRRAKFIKPISLEETLLLALSMPLVLSTGMGTFWVVMIGLEGLSRVLLITIGATTAFSILFLTPLLYVTSRIGYRSTKKKLEAEGETPFPQKRIFLGLLASIPIVTIVETIVFYFMEGYINWYSTLGVTIGVSIIAVLMIFLIKKEKD